jgi:hypothetical protein
MKQDEPQLHQRAISTIEALIPPDSRERVERTYKQFNDQIRRQIREETGLRLTSLGGATSVPVRIVDGFSPAVAKLIDNHNDLMLWRLITLQPRLNGVVEGLSALLPYWSEFENWKALPAEARQSGPALLRSREVTHLLQTLAVTRTVMDEIKEIREDILGVYRFSGPQTPRIEIYWMAQALISAMIGSRIEDLTVVTLTHELAHAYTHVGSDIDGHSWDTDGFAETHLDICEGLAQHYTELIAERLASRYPGVLKAYQTLLEYQAEPYRAHLGWIDGRQSRRGEIVRAAMLWARTQGKVSRELWGSMLSSSRTSLQKH